MNASGRDRLWTAKVKMAFSSFMNRFIRLSLLVASVGLVLGISNAQDPAAPTKAAPKTAATESEADAWKALQAATRPPLPPAEWNDKKPTDEEYAAFRKKMGEAAAAAADKAKDFAARYPESAQLDDAQEIRLNMLQAAVQLGVTDRADELKELGGAARPNSKATDPFDQKMQAAVQNAMKLEDKGMEAMLLEFEKGVRAVLKEFPDRPEAYAALLQVADGVGGEKAKAIAEEIAASKAPDEIKEMAAVLLKKANLVGNPLDIQFTAVDGRKVDLANLKGKVVLVDFWATWCGPCVAELPKVKAAYDKLNPKGFEIVGISFDEDKDALESFVKKKAMAWPQYFDGEGWQNKFGKQFGISGIPTMWLVDKKGNLRDLSARDDLVGKVEKLLAEN